MQNKDLNSDYFLLNQMNNHQTIPNNLCQQNITTTANGLLWPSQFNDLTSIPYTYYQSYPTYYYSTSNFEPNYSIKVEKVENGFIVHKNGKKFIISEPEEIIKYLKDGNDTK